MNRFLDIVASAVALLLARSLAALSLLVRHKGGCLALFRQVCSSLQGKPFEIAKFRTVNDLGARFPSFCRCRTEDNGGRFFA